MKEIWKDVFGYEGTYQVSNLGNIKTFNWKNTGKERVMRPAVDGSGYLRTMLAKDGVNKTVKIHRLIAETFIDNPENKAEVNHIDGNKTNNRVDNLEWSTRAENINHAIKNGLFAGCLKAIEKSNTKLMKPIIAIDIHTGQSIYFKSIRDAERALNTKHINKVIRGERKQANGYTFKYA